MGVEDWENKYKGQGKPQLSDFLDDEEDNVILRMGKSYPEPSHTSIRQSSHCSGFLPATYPEGYDTIDRRRKKKIRDPGGLLSTETDRMREEAFPSDLALLREKRGELFMRQVAEMQEEEERMTSCLRPYKNGLLYKTRMWAKTELDNTLENYVAYKKEQDARMRARFDFDLETSEDLQYSYVGVDENIDDIGFITEDFHPESTRHYKDRYSYSYEGHMENAQGLREKKCGKGKIGGWATEAMLSPVEEPSDEYVDPMDELQCLVETVSEYLAEKEEEISKYGSLPKSSKSRLSSQGSYIADSFGEEQNCSSKDQKGKSTHTPTDQSISGVKNAMSSLFNSFTDRVGGGPKQPVTSPQPPSSQPSQSGLTKLLSFIPKSNSSAPVAVVSPVETSHEKSFSSLPSQPQHDAKTQGYSQETRGLTRTKTPESANEYIPEFTTKPPSAPGNSVLGKLNPLKLFSAGDIGNSAENKQTPQSAYSQDHTQWDEKHSHQGKQSVTADGGWKSEELRSSSQQKHFGQQQDGNLYSRQNPMINKQENVPVPGPASQTGQTQPANTGFFSPFKKSLSSLITPVVPVPPQGAPPIAVYPVFGSTQDPRLEKPLEDPSLNSNIKRPSMSSEHVSTQHSKAEGGMLSGFLKFASSEDVSASMNTQNSVQPRHNITSASSTLNTAAPKENTEKGWFSSMFNPTSAPSGSNQNFTSHLQSQNSRVPSGSHAQHISNQKLTTAHHEMQHQAPNQPESQSFLTGLFKGSSTEDVSHMGSNQTKQGGLLSGLLKFGPTNDQSGNLPQQTSHDSQPPRGSNPPQFPHNHPPQQRSSAPQTGGLISGLLKFSSTENIPQNMQPSVAEMQRNIPGNYSGQQQTSDETQSQPQQKGLLSGLLKFASSEKFSSSQTVQHQQGSLQHKQEDLNPQTNQSPNQVPHFRNRTSSQHVIQQETSKPGFTRQQTVPLQQQPSKQSGLLSGLFKFASADNINTQQHPSAQPPIIPPSKSSHEQTRPRNNPTSNENQPQNDSTQKTTTNTTTGLLSGLFKSPSENMSQQQTRTIHETQQVKVPSSQTAETQPETASQSGVLSGLFSKLTKSSENIDTTCQTSTSPHQKTNDYTVITKTPQQTQLHTNVTQQSSQEHEAQEKRIPRTAQQGFLSGLFSKNVTEDPSPPKQAETSGQNAEQQTPLTRFTESPVGKLKSTSSDFGRDYFQRVVPGSFNPGKSRHAVICPPASVDTESLDLRTSATFARSLQSQAAYSSFSTGNLSQLYYSSPLQSVHPMAYSTGNINSLLQSHTNSSVMTTQLCSGGSNSSLYEATRQNLYQGQLSPYGLSPSYDENQWIRESALWQQFQNESLNYQFQGEDQVYRQSCDGASSALCSTPSNIYQPYNSSTPWHGVSNQEQIRPYQLKEQRNDDLYTKRKLWNSYEDLGDREYASNEEGVLNLTTKQSNTKFGKWHSFNDGSTYSLNGVSYHEGYYEETAPSLSYAANWQYGIDNAALQNVNNDGISHRSQFNLNRPIDSNYLPSAQTEMEDSLYLEDTEWYQQWLALLEQGMWWPAEDGDCGYFVYTDHEYIYALLTDAAGEYVYACGPEGESLGNAQKLDGFPSAWLHNEMVCVCGFKIPLYNEDELLWLPGQDHCDSQLLNAPLDLTAAYRKGNQIMNLNLEKFSQMFENSFVSQGQQGVDFTSYRLNKVRMDPRQASYMYEDQCNGVIDLSCHNKDHMGPYWNNQEMKTFLAQKVAVSLNSTPAANLNHQLLHNCYQPCQRRRSSTGVTVKHVDDVLEEEWRKRVCPGEQQPNRQVKKVSSLISSFVGKTSQTELNNSTTSTSDQAPDKNTKNILSSGFQSLKSKIIKEEPIAVKPDSIKQQIQKPASTQGRILPTIPTTAQVTHPSVQSHTTSQKPRLSRQATMGQQTTAPPLPNVAVPLGSKESLNKPVPPGQRTSDKPMDTPGEKPSEQPQAGFMNFLKTAVGIEEPKPDPQKFSQTVPNQQSKSGSPVSLPDTTTSSKEATGVPNLFGSISSLFSTEPSPPQKQQMKPSATEASLTSRPKVIQRQQTMDQSGTSRPLQGQPPNKSISQAFSPNSSTGPEIRRSETVPPKQDSGNKPSGGLFGFSIGEMLSGSTAAAQSGPTPQTPASATAPQEESLGKSILSIFSVPNPPQASPNTGPMPQVRPPSATPQLPQQESLGKSILSIFSGPTPPQASPNTSSMPQACQPSAAPQPPQQESLGKSILSMFGGSSPPQPPTQTKSAAEVPQQGAVPPKDPPNSGIFSLFGGPSTQQSQAQTGSLLGGILPGSSTSSESPVKGLLSMFSDPSPPPSQSPTLLSQQRVAQSQTQQGEPQTQTKPQAQGQPATSVLGGLLGGLSTSSESPGKSLFSMFSGPSAPQTPGDGGNSNLSTSPGTAAPKEPVKSVLSVFNDVVSPPQQTANSSAAVSAPKEISSLQQGSQMYSVSSSPVPEAVATSETSSEVHVSPSTESTVDATRDATIKGTDVASMAPNTECFTAPKEMSTDGASQDSAPSKEPPASGFLSMISGSGQQTPSTQAGFISDSPGKGLLSLFSGPSTVTPSPTGSAPGSSGPKDAPAKGLFSVFGGSAPQPSSQPGGSLLGSMFGGSSPQTTASQTGGSLLGGLFGGSVSQAAPQVGPTKIGGAAPQTAGPQAGASLLGGLFGGAAPQAAGSQTGGSVLGGIFGGSAASATAPPTVGSFGGIFGGAANQSSASSNNSSILGGIFGGSSSQTSAAQTGASRLGGILPGASAPNDIPDKSLISRLEGSVPPAAPTPTTTPKPSDDSKTAPDSLIDTAINNKEQGEALQQPDNKTTLALAGSEKSVIDTATKSTEQEVAIEQPNSDFQCLGTSMPKSDVSVIEEVHSKNNDMPSALANDIPSKESEVCAPAQQPARPELVGDQSSQDTVPPKIEGETSATQSANVVVQGQQKPSEPDTVTGLMSSLFKPTVTSTEGSQQQQKNSLFGLGGTAPQAATGQSGGSLLGSIFGGSNTETAAPEAGVSLLGGLFKGPASQPSPQPTAPTTGGSLLGGMFGGGSTAKSAGPQSGGSLLGGMFGGSAATAQPGNSLLGGIFGGVTAQTAGPQTGASILGGIGGSLFGGMGQPSKSPETMPAEPKPTPGTTPHPQSKIESVPPKVSPSGTPTSTKNIVDSTVPENNQEQQNSRTSGSAVTSEPACPETSAVTGASINTTVDVTHQVDNTEKSAVEGEIIHEKPMIIKGDPESKESDKSVPPNSQEAHANIGPPVNQLPNNAENPQAKSLFGFISTQSDAGKSLGSLFSPAIPSGTMPQNEGGSGLFSGLKTLSGGLFQEEKPVAGKQEPTTTSLFGSKISFPWQAEPPKPQSVPVVTSQPKTNNPTSDQTHTVQKVTSDAQKSESVGFTDAITNPQICISTPEVDPSASLTPKEKERLVETDPSSGPTSGVELDNQSKKDLLNAKRLVEA